MKMTIEQKEFLNTLIDDVSKALPPVEKFGTDDGDADEIINKVFNEIGNSYPEMEINSGISKLCVSVPELPFVVKVPYKGIWNYSYNDEDCCGDCDQCTLEVCCNETEGTYEFSEFTYNYCDKEIEDYESAVEICPEAAEILVPTEYYTAHEGYEFYIQEKVDVYSYDDEITKQPVYSKRAKLVDNYCGKKNYYINNQWSVKAIQFFGAQKFFAFVAKLYDVENIFRDLHTGNLGYRLNGAPCILDFAGFNN